MKVGLIKWMDDKDVGGKELFHEIMKVGVHDFGGRRSSLLDFFLSGVLFAEGLITP